VTLLCIEDHLSGEDQSQTKLVKSRTAEKVSVVHMALAQKRPTFILRGKNY